ncbi:MAG: aminotransferase class III-fold pyridoxal phosphate-dependent enzyme, partial [Pseudomonadota bacterium]
GLGRRGAGQWGFARHGIEPDLVTMGNPRGTGFPMAGVATRPDLLAAFCEDFGYFNTFGGNPVAAAAGEAVLDVIAEEGLIDNAEKVGAHLIGRLRALAASDDRIADVRGAGLFIGVDICADGAPDPALAADVINGLRDRRALIGAAGKYGHTLKLRPPLPLTTGEADLFVEALRGTLASKTP